MLKEVTFCEMILLSSVLLAGADVWSVGGEIPDLVDPYDFFSNDKDRCQIHIDELEKCRLMLKASAKDGNCGYSPELEKCQTDLGNCQTSARKAMSQDTASFIHIVRHIENLISEQPSYGQAEGQIGFQISEYSRRKLQKFLQDGSGGQAEVLDIIKSSLFSSESSHCPSSINGQVDSILGLKFIHLVLIVIIPMAFILYGSHTKVSWYRMLVNLIILGIFVSIFWNWYYLYQRELAKRAREMHEFENLEEECGSPEPLTAFQAIKKIFQRKLTVEKDHCLSFHERLLVDPIYEVTPVMAISYTFSSMLVEPLKNLGKGLSGFHLAFFENLPILLWLPAMVFCLLTLAVYVYFSNSRGRDYYDGHPQWGRTRLHQQPRVEDLPSTDLPFEYSKNDKNDGIKMPRRNRITSSGSKSSENSERVEDLVVDDLGSSQFDALTGVENNQERSGRIEPAGLNTLHRPKSFDEVNAFHRGSGEPYTEEITIKRTFGGTPSSQKSSQLSKEKPSYIKRHLKEKNSSPSHLSSSASSPSEDSPSDITILTDDEDSPHRGASSATTSEADMFMSLASEDEFEVLSKESLTSSFHELKDDF